MAASVVLGVTICRGMYEVGVTGGAGVGGDNMSGNV